MGTVPWLSRKSAVHSNSLELKSRPHRLSTITTEWQLRFIWTAETLTECTAVFFNCKTQFVLADRAEWSGPLCLQAPLRGSRPGQKRLSWAKHLPNGNKWSADPFFPSILTLCSHASFAASVLLCIWWSITLAGASLLGRWNVQYACILCVCVWGKETERDSYMSLIRGILCNCFSPGAITVIFASCLHSVMFNSAYSWEDSQLCNIPH